MTAKKVVEATSHEQKINDLIPFAVKKADLETTNRAEWAKVYIEEMNKLTIERGLRVPIEVILKERFSTEELVK
jgi:hypothetical protein